MWFETMKWRSRRWTRASFRMMPGLYSVDQFAAALDRARSRSDRHGNVFSLLTFTLGNACRASDFTPLVHILCKRIRSTDELGWMDETRVGVLLPDTPAASASKVADDVVALYPTTLAAPSCEIYTYPSDWPSLAVTRRSPALVGAVANRRVRSMETLFAQPLPRWKRAIDIVGAAIGLLTCLPIIAVAAIAIRLTSKGPVLIAQQRAGLAGVEFTMYKLRTMHANAAAQQKALLHLNEQDGPAFKITRDPRVTPVGRILRTTSIDELPQLWNVLLGEMSLVGPRPLPSYESDACTAWQRQRLDVTPGLTCIWQVSGRPRSSFADWVRMDVRYARSRSLAHDAKLLLQTVPTVVLRRGAC